MARTILLADDDADTRIILRAILERDQCTVVDAATADDAMAATERHVFDLVVMNYPMYTAGGTTLPRALRSLERTRRVPIVNLTSRVVPQFLQNAADEGVALSIAKPVDVQRMLAIVAQFTAYAPALVAYEPRGATG